MTIPDYQTIMLPLLQIMSDKKEHSIQDITKLLGDHFKLSDEEINELLTSGKQTIFYNRVGWARTYLSKAGLVKQTKKSCIVITDEGNKVLSENLKKITNKYLMKYPSFVEFRKRRKKVDNGKKATQSKDNDELTPEENLENSYQEIRDKLSYDLLELVKTCTPKFFERLVVEMLVKMGYGGSWKDASKAIGQVGDGGIDGIIDEDRLGLDSIYIQAKKWTGAPISRPELQKFVGALAQKHARKGIFITTSSFSKDAISFAENIEYRIVLIDGERLTEYMIDYGIGVTNIASYDVKRIDNDFFLD